MNQAPERRETTLLTVNAGSSSLKLVLFAVGGGVPRRLGARTLGPTDDASAALDELLAAAGVARPGAIAHRVVHGGAALTRTTRIDAATEAQIAQAALLAPLHNPLALAQIRHLRERFPDTPQYAAFDTAFFAGLPQVARTLPLPRRLVQRHELRRYGFHGLAHGALWQRLQALSPCTRMISLHLGSGCSAAAVREGVPLDTSMGLSPLEGLMMSTRGGDIDPGVLIALLRAERLDADGLERILTWESGLAGLSGRADMRQLLAATDEEALLAVDLFCYRARKYIGAYLTVLGGADAIVFSGGIGEHAPQVRAQILEPLAWAGIELDAAANAAAVGREACISRPGSRVAVWVIPGDEALAIAQEAVAAGACSSRPLRAALAVGVAA